MEIQKLNPERYEKCKEELIRLFEIHFREIGSEADRGEIDQSFKEILDESSPAHLFCLMNQFDKPVGFCLVNLSHGVESGGKYLWINDILISESYRKEKNATQLLKHIIEWAKENDCKKALAITSTENRAAQQLVSQLGFSAREVIWLTKAL